MSNSVPSYMLDSLIAHQFEFSNDDNIDMDKLTEQVLKEQENQIQKKNQTQKEKKEKKRQINLQKRFNNKYNNNNNKFSINQPNNLNINNNNDFINNYLRISNMTYEELLNLENKIGDVNKGLNQEEIDNLGEEIYNSFINLTESTKKCIICLSDFFEGEKIRYLKCNHFFHKDCIDNWLKLQKKCPTCNQEVI